MQVAAWLSHIKTENIAYPACTLQYNGKQCSKKVQDSGGGQGDMQVHLCIFPSLAFWSAIVAV